MKRDELTYLEAKMMDEFLSRRHLGGYSTDSETILKIIETLFRILEHLGETAPKEKK